MRHVILMPDLGQTTNEAKVLHWYKRLGDRVSKGEALVEVETDKADMDVECFVDGFLRETLVAEQSMAIALEPVAIITDSPDEDYEAVKGDKPLRSKEGAPASESIARAERVFAAPAARKRAADLKIDLIRVSGTGPNGMVTKKDVEQFAVNGTRASSADVKNRGRAAMATLVQRSKSEIPHFYVGRRLILADASQARDSWNAAHPDCKLTWNDVFVRAASFALIDVPQLNQRLTGEIYESHSDPDVLVVTAVEGGLSLVPTKAPAEQDVAAFAIELRAALAKQGLPANSGKGPCFAVSNLGMHDVEEFTAIIPPSCCAILAVGKVSAEPVVRDGEIEAAPVCHVTLSVDHRIADGIVAARFLTSFDRHLNSADLWA